MSTGPLAGRHALVTGGGRGIGRAVAGTLVRAGARVTIVGRDAAVLAEVVEAGDAHGHEVADVTDAESMSGAAARAAAAWGAIELLVANAGSAVSKPFGRTGPDDFQAMWAVNVMGVVNAAQAVLPHMTERGFGRIVAIASTAGVKGFAYVTAYCAAKHGVVGLVRALAQETARTGVTVNAVCPGYTDTDLVTRSVDAIMAKTGRNREAVLGDLTQANPQGGLIEPGEVADAVLWLCGDAARSITGQAIAVAGGEV